MESAGARKNGNPELPQYRIPGHGTCSNQSLLQSKGEHVTEHGESSIKNGSAANVNTLSFIDDTAQLYGVEFVWFHVYFAFNLKRRFRRQRYRDRPESETET
jgi:hypothetical protein